ncbi:MAG TPA: hypothetical protein VJ023_09230 [Pyrinomonadaceae bacterium]|nr:hypothetical protein [Pyrinomonadaceae bacterium]
MEETFTETAESNAALLSGWQVTNFNLSELNSEVTLTFISQPLTESTARLAMFASEAILRREWDTPEEDEAWADL